MWCFRISWFGVYSQWTHSIPFLVTHVTLPSPSTDLPRWPGWALRAPLTGLCIRARRCIKREKKIIGDTQGTRCHCGNEPVGVCLLFLPLLGNWDDWPTSHFEGVFFQQGSVCGAHITGGSENGKKTEKNLLLPQLLSYTWLGNFAILREWPFSFEHPFWNRQSLLLLVSTFCRGVWKKVVTFQNGLIKDVLNWMCSWISFKCYLL